MFRAAYRSSSSFAASGLYSHVVTGRCPGWVGTGQFPPSLDNAQSPHGYINQRLQMMMMSGMPLETC